MELNFDALVSEPPPLKCLVTPPKTLIILVHRGTRPTMHFSRIDHLDGELDFTSLARRAQLARELATATAVVCIEEATSMM